MSQKRPRDDDEQARSDGHNPSIRKQKKARRSVTIEDNEELLSSISKLVKKEVKKAKKQVKKELKKKFGWLLRKYCASKKWRHGRQMRKLASRTLQLKFRNNLSLPIFTLTEIEGKDPSVLTIALVDAMTGQVVNSGPESSMKVEIVILEGNKGDEDNNWTFEHFSNNIVREGKDNQTLLTGDVFLTLNEGIGVASKLKITDNSSRTKKRKFRLAARVPDGYFDGIRVKEAITEPFAVKDRRGKSYMKKHPPSLDDEVWRLEKIGKELSKRLSSKNVNTVKDFLLMLHADTPRLRKILGLGMNDRRWDIIKNHAEECDPGSEMCVYKDERGKGVVFNIVGTVIGFLLKGQLIPINDLLEIQKADMEQMVEVAYRRWEEVVPYVNGDIPVSSPNVPVDSFHCGSPSLEIPTISNSQHSGGHYFVQSDIAFHPLMVSPDYYNMLDIGFMEWENDASSLIHENFWWQNDARAALCPQQEPQADHVNATSSFSNVPLQSVAVKDKARSTWKMRMIVLTVSKWIVALKLVRHGRR